MIFNDESQNSGPIILFFRGFIFIGILGLFILMMLGDFFGIRNEENYGLTFIIFSMSLIFIYVFFPFFEEIKIGKIIELKRKIKEVVQEKVKLEQKNSELISHIVNVTNSVNQKQNNITVHGIPAELLSLFSVTKASEEDVEKSKKETPVDPDPVRRAAMHERMEKRRVSEKKIILNEIKNKPNPLTEAKFSSSFDAFDPIMKDRAIIFDGYYKQGDDEIFIELINRKGGIFYVLDRLYVYLNKIHLYRVAKKNNSRLLVVLYEIEDENNDRRIDIKDNIENFFRPALEAGLLEIKIYSPEDINDL